MSQQYTAEEGDGAPAVEEMENLAVPIIAIMAIGLCSSLVTFKVLTHKKTHGRVHNFDPFKMLGISILVALGGGLHYSMFASQPAGVSFESMNSLMKKPVLVGGIVVLAAILPLIESYLHTVM